MDTLRAAVSLEREEVARETAHVATLAKVNCTALNMWLGDSHGHYSVIGSLHSAALNIRTYIMYANSQNWIRKVAFSFFSRF